MASREREGPVAFPFFFFPENSWALAVVACALLGAAAAGEGIGGAYQDLVRGETTRQI